ncbi:MAG: FadR family transcriptional regulator [Microbacteriaceae bacterium]|nr:FadR family transcriptional regulator [Microbacteriaceae bacterium]
MTEPSSVDTRVAGYSNAAHRIPKMAEVIAAELRARILGGELKPGDSLFTESALMETYEVSRPTLREALRLLEAQNLLTVRRGSHKGPVVSLPDISVAAQTVAIQLQLRDATLGDVYQFRAFFEPHAVRLAAERATPADVVELQGLIDDAALKLGNPTAFAIASWRIHLSLINLSGNATMGVIAETLQRISEQHSARSMEVAADREVQQERALKAHRRVVELLAANDGPGAESFWSRHMTVVSDVMVRENSDMLISGLFR